MGITLDEIRATLTAYLERHPGERDDLDAPLAAIAAGRDVVSRDEPGGHVTCGALLLDTDGRILHVHHATLGRWLLPGGHLEPGDSSLVTAALRELREETGISAGDVTPAGDGLPVDIDVHTIPGNPREGQPEHWHADFVYAFHAAAPEVVLDPEEVTDFAWFERPAAGGLDAKLEAVRAGR